MWRRLITQSKQTEPNCPEPQSPKLWKCLFGSHRQSTQGHIHYLYFKTHLQCRCHAFSWAFLRCKRRPCIALHVRLHDIIPCFYSNISPCTLCSGQYYLVSQRAQCTIGILLTTLVALQMSPPPEEWWVEKLSPCKRSATCAAVPDDDITAVFSPYVVGKAATMSASGMHAHNVIDSIQEAANMQSMPATC